MAGERQFSGLQIIFSFFLGLMVTAFIGVGVYTFYPPPEVQLQEEIQDLYRQQEDLQSFKDPSKLTDAERARLSDVQAKIRVLEKKAEEAREVWGRNTSIILIAFATLVMSISLIQAENLKVISNGLLLGGLFTMIYGTGWIIATGTSQARFWVMTVALVITFALGYLRFVRGRAATPEGKTSAVAAGGASEVDVSGLEARVIALEERLGAVAEALRGEGEHR